MNKLAKQQENVRPLEELSLGLSLKPVRQGSASHNVPRVVQLVHTVVHVLRNSAPAADFPVPAKPGGWVPDLEQAAVAVFFSDQRRARGCGCIIFH